LPLQVVTTAGELKLYYYWCIFSLYFQGVAGLNGASGEQGSKVRKIADIFVKKIQGEKTSDLLLLNRVVEAYKAVWDLVDHLEKQDKKDVKEPMGVMVPR
jgi:hypothetical protein